MKEIIDFSDLTSLKLAENSNLRKLLDKGGTTAKVLQTKEKSKIAQKKVPEKKLSFWSGIKQEKEKEEKYYPENVSEYSSISIHSHESDNTK